MSKNIKYSIILLFLLFVGCSSKEEIQVSVDLGKSVTLETSTTKIVFDSDMYSTLFVKKDGKLLSLNKREKIDSESLPSFYAVTNKGVIKNFKLDFDKIETKNISTQFGKGKQVVLQGISNDIAEIPIQLLLTVELYSEFSHTSIMYAEFKNISDKKEIQLNEVFSNAYQLDATNVNKNLSSHSFYSFYGTDGRIERQKEHIISPKLNLKNFTGRPDSLEGIKQGNGGIPIVDLWCKETGIGIGHIETEWQNLYMPIKTEKNGKVFMAIREVPNLNLLKPYILKTNESYNTVKTFVNLHSLDFYNTVHTFAELMKRKGLNMTTPETDSDYLSAWCSWNDYSTHAMASKKDVMVTKLILDRLPDLKNMQIEEVIFDAGWFNNQGDWMPNEDPLTFPKSEKDIIETIKKIHEAGLKVKLWISFLTADEWSEVSKAHPEWMIKKADGSFHLDRWSGYTMCPSLSEVQEYHKLLAERLVGKYGADGFKVDGMYVCPPCYNLEHHHKNPNESSKDFYKVFKEFYNGAKNINSEVVVMACPCGSVCDYTSLPYITQTISSDPTTYETVRRRAKMYRALKGASTPYNSDFIDVNVGNMKFPTMFANAVGVGAVPQTFYGKTPSDDVLKIYKKWFGIYSKEMISRADYLNLYDMGFDKPETHVFIKKEDGKEIYYYSFYADESSWSGNVELRGLNSAKEYKVINYVNNSELGTVSASSPQIRVNFDNYLFVKCIEK